MIESGSSSRHVESIFMVVVPSAPWMSSNLNMGEFLFYGEKDDGYTQLKIYLLTGQ
jgi:hypothetical protein